MSDTPPKFPMVNSPEDCILWAYEYAEKLDASDAEKYLVAGELMSYIESLDYVPGEPELTEKSNALLSQNRGQ